MHRNDRAGCERPIHRGPYKMKHYVTIDEIDLRRLSRNSAKQVTMDRIAETLIVEILLEIQLMLLDFPARRRFADVSRL